MTTTSVKVNSKYQITIPQIARKKLNIKEGNSLLIDIQGGVIVLIPEPKSYTSHLQGLHREIWKGVDIQNYIKRERGASTNSEGD